MRRALLCSSLLLACGPAEDAARVVATQEAAIAKLTLGREEPRGVAPGFDLDADVSVSDGRSCYQRDFTDSAGREGIDNQLARLMPLIDLAGEGALEGLIQGAINEGRALMLLRVEDRADGLVDLSMLRGDDTPLLGTDGYLLPGQTLAVRADTLLGRFTGGTREGHVLRFGPMDLELPVVVFSLLYTMNLHRAYVEFDLMEDGTVLGGRLGGAVRVDQVLALASQAAERTHGLEMLLNGGVRDVADLDRDASGACQSLSMGVTFSGVPAFSF